ncbi:hypothetical protein PHYBOEH_008190 [Phytophthora boehmeriae]|uniref:glucan endo-1,3-beta-D-glucosidase n=1 Tax=Phytophthora boehmeriae TaxID=109152 RepID=A0A8T1X6L8_9STRA|nr:hypothetical protein PHYBOEH_008190 [Phytophthora boehmeriae]
MAVLTAALEQFQSAPARFQHDAKPVRRKAARIRAVTGHPTGYFCRDIRIKVADPIAEQTSSGSLFHLRSPAHPIRQNSERATMKCFTLLSIGIALLSAQVSANGVCYDPNHADNGAMDAATVAADMATIKSRGFNAVRTYISKFGPTEIGPIITSHNLTAALGVPYPQSDYQEQKEAALTAANAGGVGYIFVGNENLAGATFVPLDMIKLVQSIKSLVPPTVKVGTVQRNTEVINYASISGWSDLVAACDVLGVNLHPYFNPGTTADNAIDVFNNQWTIMEKNFGDKLILTETGWPSQGSILGNVGSTAGALTYFSDYKSWSSSQIESFYFQMFDTPYKSEEFEKFFGLLTSDSQNKFDFAAASAVNGGVSPK